MYCSIFSRLKFPRSGMESFRLDLLAEWFVNVRIIPYEFPENPVIPRNLRISCAFLGSAKGRIAELLSSPGSITFSLILWPRNLTDYAKKIHLMRCKVKPVTLTIWRNQRSRPSANVRLGWRINVTKHLFDSSEQALDNSHTKSQVGQDFFDDSFDMGDELWLNSADGSQRKIDPRHLTFWKLHYQFVLIISLILRDEERKLCK